MEPLLFLDGNLDFGNLPVEFLPFFRTGTAPKTEAKNHPMRAAHEGVQAHQVHAAELRQAARPLRRRELRAQGVPGPPALGTRKNWWHLTEGPT